ncbi:MAG TPA: AAA domain-containing protein [Candidatus Omnitrophota bacterium]|nr:AAA domain-containing protein [Candidatus Omnitrophota bacterium]HPS36908.1 AAA domain-containing protein [Candidatus Omnitrophota bacterium]
MSNTFRDKPSKRRKKVHAPLPPRVEKKEERKIWVGDEAFVEKHFLHLTRLLRDEEREETDRFRSEVLDRKPEERERSGKAIFRLELLETHYNPSGQKLLTFALANGRPLPRYSLNPGDLVTLSGFQTPLAECSTGAVYEKDRMRITVAFSGRIYPWVERENSFQLSLAANRTTYQRMYEAMHMVRTADHSRVAVIRDISLRLKEPRFGDPVPPEKMPFLDTTLSDEQRKAVCLAHEAEDIFLIHGPPGTGKTRVLVEIVRQAVSRGEAVLLSAPSNAACDHLVECLVAHDVPVTRLGQPARITERIREHTLSYKLTKHPYAKMIDEHEARLDQIDRQKERRQDRRVMSWDEKRELREEVYKLRDDIRDLKAQLFKQVWNAADVVVATHTVCGDPLIRAKSFQWVILDEATQGIEPATWIPILHAGKVVLAGDHCQLPPTVRNFQKNEKGLSFTLFERLHLILPAASRVRLERQYRMHEDIMNFPSREFYEGKLFAEDPVAHHTLKDLPHVKAGDLNLAPIVFRDTAGLGYEEEEEEGTGSRCNPQEAKLVVKELERLLADGVKPEEVGLISPYSAQVKLLNSLILGEKAEPAALAGLEIDSIDSFQGREKEVVIVSLVRSNIKGQLGFLTDTRRMNVAMTRAKRKLIVIGDSATLSNFPFYEDFLKYVESINAYHSAWEDT